MKPLRSLLAVVFLWPLLALAHPADTYRFHSPEAERRAMSLSRELRCPQCQNQNLMESNSPVAMDLRLEVYKLVDSGQSDEKVITYMTDRFGDFVRYRPPLKTGTLLLWGAPALLLLLALWMLLRGRYKHPLSALRKEAAGSPARKEENSTITLPESPAARFVVSGIVAAALLTALGGYAYSGRWQLSEHWRHNPDPLLSMDGEDLKDASLKRLQERLRDNPRDMESWTELGQLYAYRDEFEQALKVYGRIAEIEGTESASTLAAKATVLYYQAGQRLTPEAHRLLDQALALDPGEVTALMLQASEFFLQAQYSEAIAIWQKLLDEERPRINREQLIRAIQTARQFGG